MVPVVTLFSTDHSKGKILALSQDRKINVMDKLWDRKSFEVGGHCGHCGGNDKNLMTTNQKTK